MEQTIYCQKAVCEGREWIAVFIPKADRLIEQVKQVEGRRWHPAAKCWLAPYGRSSWAALGAIFQKDRLESRQEVLVIAEPLPSMQSRKRPEKEVREVGPPLPEVQQVELYRMMDKLMLKRYSKDTHKSYTSHFRCYLYALEGRPPQDMGKEVIHRYLLKRIREDKISESTQNGIINALKFYYEQVLGRPREYYDVQRPKKPNPLPDVLSLEEVVRLLEATTNLKHRSILMMIYSAGLRLGELIKLRRADLHPDRWQVFIKAGKGKKDRYSILSPQVWEALQAYLTEYKPRYWLFEGQDGGAYSRSSVQQIFRRAVAKSGVNPFATVHTLRHSFATHIHDRGVDIREIQGLLGHDSIKTTEIYTHLVNKRPLQSPFDFLNWKK
ncbi:MAG: site-specific integrase [Saprospirales bacterium]|nr:site-specific integrase [Saprospirales bacterium]MBK8490139.1 site-specific integrase [Saprospirales bacterium]